MTEIVGRDSWLVDKDGWCIAATRGARRVRLHHQRAGRRAGVRVRLARRAHPGAPQAAVPEGRRRSQDVHGPALDAGSGGVS